MSEPESVNDFVSSHCASAFHHSAEIGELCSACKPVAEMLRKERKRAEKEASKYFALDLSATANISDLKSENKALEARMNEAEKLLEEQECVHNTLQMQRLREKTRDYFRRKDAEDYGRKREIS